MRPAEREPVLVLLKGLRWAPVATDDEELFFIGRYALMGRGFGCLDVHLPASVALHRTARRCKRDAGVRTASGSLVEPQGEK